MLGNRNLLGNKNHGKSIPVTVGEETDSQSISLHMGNTPSRVMERVARSRHHGEYIGVRGL